MPLILALINWFSIFWSEILNLLFFFPSFSILCFGYIFYFLFCLSFLCKCFPTPPYYDARQKARQEWCDGLHQCPIPRTSFKSWKSSTEVHLQTLYLCHWHRQHPQGLRWRQEDRSRQGAAVIWYALRCRADWTDSWKDKTIVKITRYVITWLNGYLYSS